jgi:hypothetical protein
MLLLSVTSLLALGAGPQEAEPMPRTQSELVPSVCIWSEAPHSAFTDLVHHDGRFFCAFREGSGHVPGESGTDGVIRLIVSPDGEAWSTAACIVEEGVDLRDPKLSVTPDGRLMVLMAGSVYDEGRFVERVPRACFSKPGGKDFTAALPLTIDPRVATDRDWLWRVTWHEGVAFGVVYQAAEVWGLHLLRSSDGMSYELVHTLDLDDRPNEATVRFLEDGRMVMVVRREGGERLGVVGVSSEPYQEWSWRSIGRRLGGPDLAVLADGSLILGTRDYGPEKTYSTILGRLGLDGSFERLFDLPSGGDTSYPGLLVHEDELWVSYYSSHEERSSIYLARVPLEELEKRIARKGSRK